jgi:hypothetical protein
VAFDNLHVGSAHADGNRLDEHRSVSTVRLGHVFEARRVALQRFDDDGLHGVFGSR